MEPRLALDMKSVEWEGSCQNWATLVQCYRLQHFRMSFLLPSWRWPDTAVIKEGRALVTCQANLTIYSQFRCNHPKEGFKMIWLISQVEDFTWEPAVLLTGTCQFSLSSTLALHIVIWPAELRAQHSTRPCSAMNMMVPLWDILFKPFKTCQATSLTSCTFLHGKRLVVLTTIASSDSLCHLFNVKTWYPSSEKKTLAITTE